MLTAWSLSVIHGHARVELYFLVKGISPQRLKQVHIARCFVNELPRMRDVVVLTIYSFL